MLNIDLSGKKALVTGAGRGLGKSIALVLAECGADVYLGNRKEEQGKQTVDEILAKGRKAAFSKCDVSIEEDVKNLVDDALKFFDGKLDIFVNAAGVISLEDLRYAKEEEQQRILNINVIGTSNGIKYVLPIMEKQKSGSIITVSSIAGRGGLPMLQMYCASKAAVISLTQSAARMAASSNVRVNSIAPGIIRTAMWEEILDGMATGFNPANKNTTTPEEREAMWNNSIASMIPLKTAQTGEDIAWATAFLVSDYARAITGQTLAVDGGNTMV